MSYQNEGPKIRKRAIFQANFVLNLKNMTEKSKRIIVGVISIMFVLLFVYAASSKFFDFQKFQVQLSQSPLLTRNAILISWIIPILEIGISLLLSSELLRLPGLYLFVLSHDSLYRIYRTHHPIQ